MKKLVLRLLLTAATVLAAIILPITATAIAVKFYGARWTTALNCSTFLIGFVSLAVVGAVRLARNVRLRAEQAKKTKRALPLPNGEVA